MATTQRHLILVTGEEGAGKSTLMSALLQHTPDGAKLDAEDVGQVNPFEFGETFLDLLWRNVAGCIANFWGAGYRTVITGSLLDGDTFASFERFRRHIPTDVAIHVVQLRASKSVRDERRIRRDKPSSKEWRDRVDASYPREDTGLRDRAKDYQFFSLDNSTMQVEETAQTVMARIPEVYGGTDVRL
jgi:dephospho-CoA kinase